MRLRDLFLLMFVSFVLGVSVVLLAVVKQPKPERVTRIVCESGDEIAASGDDDPFLVWRASCTVNDANGRAVDVVMID